MLKRWERQGVRVDNCSNSYIISTLNLNLVTHISPPEASHHFFFFLNKASPHDAHIATESQFNGIRRALRYTVFPPTL